MLQLLSSASLILAIVGVFYGLWYADIEQAIETKMPRHQADREEPLSNMRSVLHHKAYPLAGMSALLFLIYLPVFISTAYESLVAMRGVLTSANRLHYEPAKASLLLVILLMFALAFYSGWSAWKLRKVIQDAQ